MSTESSAQQSRRLKGEGYFQKGRGFMKKTLLFSLLLFACHAVFAQATQQGLAGQFAQEAGKIGGIARACGQDLSVYNGRVSEAINAMTDNKESQSAITTYTAAVANAAEIQSKTQAINCSTALQSFSTLPLMQSNYKTEVLPALAKMANSQGAVVPSAPATPATQTPSTSPTQPSTQLVPLQFAQTPPAQQLVTGNTTNAP
jgi:hypothetical protein